MSEEDTSLPVKQKKRGRPKKSDLPSNKKRGRGRPKGVQGIINDYRDRMLASPKSRKVLDAIFDAALDPEHKNQAAAWKLVMDRVAPVAAFEKEITKGGGRPTITINIGEYTGEKKITTSENEIDAEYSEIDS